LTIATAPEYDRKRLHRKRLQEAGAGTPAKGGRALGEEQQGADPPDGARGTISVTDAVKQFEGGVLAVDHVSFEATPGEFVSIVGPSGCGKSTLLRLIAGLIPLSAGSISVNGLEVTEPRQDVALMFQRPTLLPWRTALQNALLPPKLGRRLDEGTSGRRTSCSIWLASRASSTPTLATSPAACSSASRLPACSWSASRFCCSTSPSRPSTS
jgi:hypothetical protein